MFSRLISKCLGWIKGNQDTARNAAATEGKAPSSKRHSRTNSRDARPARRSNTEHPANAPQKDRRPTEPAAERQPNNTRSRSAARRGKPQQRTAKPAVIEAQDNITITEDLAQGAVFQSKPKEFGGWQPPPPVRENEGDTIFQDFVLDGRILRAIIEDLQFTRCTPIQALALPHVLAGEDIAGKAQTGTGKTATFLIGMLQKFLTTRQDDREPNQPAALVLAPTRELAIQIAHDANSLCAYCHFKTVAVYGGMDYDKQRRMLNSHVDMVVATPGRLIDFLQQYAVDLSRVQTLIIDEADRMLDMGFIPDVKRIISRLKGPETRQTMLFSATLNTDIMNLAARWMRPNPVRIEVEPEHVVADGIEERIYAVTAAEKLPIVLWTLRHEDCHRVLIFRNRRSEVETLHEELRRFGVASEMLSGDVDQKKRLRILEDFKLGKVKVIVATDVAGRGIHVEDITHVINYDFPYEAEDYVHRVGRTARAGHNGCAISFADENSAFVIPDIETYIGRSLPITTPTDEMLQLPEEYRHLKPRVEKSHSMRPMASGGYGHGGYHRRGSAPRTHYTSR